MDIHTYCYPYLNFIPILIQKDTMQKDTNTDTKSLEYFSLGPQTYFSGPIRHMIQDAKIVKDAGNLKKMPEFSSITNIIFLGGGVQVQT